MRKGFYFIGLFVFVLMISTAFRSPRQSATLDNELLVKFKADVSMSSQQSIFSQSKTIYSGEIKEIGVKRLRVAQDQTVDQAIQILSRSSDVLYAEPVYLYEASVQPNDPFFTEEWGMENTGQNSGTAGADISAIAAWDSSQGTHEIIVGIIDTGIDFSHEDLAANIYTNPGEDAWADPNDPSTGNKIDDDGNGRIDDWKGWNFADSTNDASDDNMHGTHCAGIIGAVGNNGKGVTGVNWQVQLMPLKFLDYQGVGSSVDAIEAIIYAVNSGVTVLNNSWGGSGFSYALRDAIQFARDHGVLFVAAAGNDGVNTDVDPEYPACYDLSNIISVAASDRNDQRALWGDSDGGGTDCGILVCSNVMAAVPGSNYGATTVDIAAPGKEIYSTLPNGQYGSLSGTSMATPFVAGAAALLWGSQSQLNAQQVKDKILSTADILTAFNGITVSGGRLNLEMLLK